MDIENIMTHNIIKDDHEWYIAGLSTLGEEKSELRNWCIYVMLVRGVFTVTKLSLPKVVMGGRGCGGGAWAPPLEIF